MKNEVSAAITAADAAKKFMREAGEPIFLCEEWRPLATAPRSGRFLLYRLNRWGYPRIAHWSTGSLWADSQPLPISVFEMDEFVWRDLPALPGQAYISITTWEDA